MIELVSNEAHLVMIVRSTTPLLWRPLFARELHRTQPTSYGKHMFECARTEVGAAVLDSIGTQSGILVTPIKDTGRRVIEFRVDPNHEEPLEAFDCLCRSWKQPQRGSWATGTLIELLAFYGLDKRVVYRAHP